MEELMKTLVCHGDSLTAPEEPERKSIWPSLVESRLKINVINSGIGGDTSGGLLSRFYPGVVQHRPDVVLILERLKCLETGSILNEMDEVWKKD
jgi:lysophospholipase L1-like esterase